MIYLHLHASINIKESLLKKEKREPLSKYVCIFIFEQLPSDTAIYKSYMQ